MLKVKELRFKRRDGSIVSRDVPEDLNQALVAKACANEYLVLAVSSSAELPEQSVSMVKYKGKTAGFVIPGQALLSPLHPRNGDPHYAAYSLVAALEVCARSFNGDFSMSSTSSEAESPGEIPFLEGDAYLVLWKKIIGLGDCSRFHPSLFLNGIYSYRGSRDYCGIDNVPPEIITLRDPAIDSQYANSVFFNLYPYASFALLRFFYAYQIIEMLIGLDFKVRSEAIRTKLNLAAPVSITTLRDIVDDFKKSYQDLPRIKEILAPPCGSTELALDRLLDEMADDRSDKSFAQKIYRVRNILFHEHLRAHDFDESVMSVGDNLIAYLARIKFSV
ncbi:hypothetical protein [Stenotrophomonas rhizophila]|uniref:hypothetical protein n=1 Tax=Stenotrophomonas rhizophila TaxID=216778 RepID=UPI00119F4CF9|nr:hypothetical protein [Stenotrophomonas rhizophila]